MMETAQKTRHRTFTLRGSLFTLSVLQLHAVESGLFEQELSDLISQAPKFFDHAPIIIDLQYYRYPEELIDFPALISALKRHHLIPVGIRHGLHKQQEAAKQVGLAVLSSAKQDKKQLQNNAPEQAPVENEQEEATTRLMTQPVRSGQQVYAKGGDLIVVASVSHGAELLADGNIHVYGTLRGRALAGISGNTAARIFCQRCDAELVSIAGHYVLNDGIDDTYKQCPQQIFFNDDKLCFAPITQ